MKYPVFEISILIDLLLSKAKEAKAYRGLVNLSEKIESSQLVSSAKSSKEHEYIYGIFHDKLPDARSKGKKELTLKESYVQEFLDYLGYESFEFFKDQVQAIKVQIEALPLEGKQVLILLPQNRKISLADRLEECYYKGQKKRLVWHSYQEIEQVSSRIAKGDPFVWMIPESLFEETKVAELITANRSKLCFIPYWLTDRRSKLNPLWQDANESVLLHDSTGLDLNLLIQLLENIETVRPKQSEVDSDIKEGINVYDSNTVVLGNMKIVADQFASRDQHIKIINKVKKGGKRHKR